MNELNPDNLAVKKVIHKNISQPKKVKLSIIVPFHKKLDLCSRLIDSIYEKSSYIDFELIMVQDASDNVASNQFFSKIPRAKYFCTESHLGFGNAVNLGLQKATNELVCIMHNDTIVTENKMFINLYDDLFSLQKESVVTISASTNNFMSKDLLAHHINESIDVPPVILDKPSPFICTMAYKELLLKAGGFPTYPFCWFECDLMGHKLKKLGFRQALSRRAFVHHEGGATVLDLIKSNSSAKSSLSENFKLYKRDLEILG